MRGAGLKTGRALSRDEDARSFAMDANKLKPDKKIRLLAQLIKLAAADKLNNKR